MRSVRKIRLLSALAATAAVVVTATACTTASSGNGKPAAKPGASGGDIVIGQLADLTGGNAPIGAENQAGAALAVKEINDAGGILGGRKIRIEVKDAATKPDQAVVAFSALQSGGAVAMLGSSFTISGLAVIPKAEAAKVPYISMAAGDQQVQPVHPYTFLTAVPANVNADRMLQFYQATGVKKIAMAFDSKNGYALAGKARMQEQAAQHGVTIVASEPFDSAATDFSPLLQHVKDSGAQDLMVWGVGAPAVLITKAFAAASLPQVRLDMSLAEATPLYLKPAGAAAENVVVAATVGLVADALPDSPIKQADIAMATAFRAANGHAPSEFAIDAYNGVKLLAAAMTKAVTTDGPAVRDALEHVSVQTISGQVAYSPTDHVGLPPEALTITQIKGGAFVPTDWAREQLAAGVK